MTHVLPQTTAELLIRAAEAVHVLGPEASTDGVGTFIGGAATHARPALTGARELGFVSNGADADHWNATNLARVLASAAPGEKMIILRLQLENFPPYSIFRDRLLAGEHPGDAARQTCLTFSLSIDPIDAEGVLTNWGTYSNGLRYGQDHRLLVPVNEKVRAEVLALSERILAERDAVRAHVVEELGVDAAGFVTGEILENLIDSYLALLKGDPPRDGAFQLGHAIEGFAKKLADLDPPLTLPGNANTLGQVARSLKDQGRLTSKHHAIVSGLTAIRNATDHAGDPEIGGATWIVTKETALVANQMAWRLMRSFFALRSGNPEL